MARFKKKSSSRRRFRGFARKRSRSRSGGAGGSDMSMILSGAAYGVVRGPVATAISGLSAKLPFGQYNDEAAMAIASYAAKKWAPIGFVKRMGTAGLIVEAASAASGATAGMIGGAAAQSNSLFSGR